MPSDESPHTISLDPSAMAALNRIATALEAIATALRNPPTSPPDVLPLNEAWKTLGYKNYLQCYRKIQSGLYRVGYEVEDRRVPGASEPSYWLNIPECRKRNAVMPAKRK